MKRYLSLLLAMSMALSLLSVPALATETTENHEHVAAAAVVENYVAPSCLEAGSYDEVVRCSSCGEVLTTTTETLDATGHTAAEAVVENLVDATTSDAGSYDEVIYCSVCKAEISRTAHTIAQLAPSNTDSSSSTTKKSITDCNVALSQTSYVYDGTEKCPTVTVMDGSATLSKGIDYTVQYIQNCAAGTASVVVHGRTYSGSKTATFTIEKAENAINVEDVTKSASSSEQSFYLNATAKSGSVTYSTSSSGISVDKTGRVTVNAGFSGTATVTVTAGTSNYKTVTKDVTITIKKMADKINAQDICLDASSSEQTYTLNISHRGSGKITYTTSTVVVKHFCNTCG